MADIELIVKIPEEKYNKFMYSDDVDEEELVEAFEYLMNGTPIPDNATNGDVVKAMFPNASFYYHKASDIVDDYVSVCIDDCDTQQYYSRAWWNAPYQKGGKE